MELEQKVLYMNNQLETYKQMTTRISPSTMARSHAFPYVRQPAQNQISDPTETWFPPSVVIEDDFGTPEYYTREAERQENVQRTLAMIDKALSF